MGRLRFSEIFLLVQQSEFLRRYADTCIRLQELLLSVFEFEKQGFTVSGCDADISCTRRRPHEVVDTTHRVCGRKILTSLSFFLTRTCSL